MNKTQKVLTGLALLALSTAPAMAQSTPKISPQSIVVNPVPTELQVKVTVNKSGENPLYRIGEQIQLSVNVNQDAYVYLFSVHSDGNIDIILPNKLSGGSTFMKAGETRQFPATNASFRFSVDGPTGQDKVLAVAAKRQLDISEIARFQAGQQFASAQVTGQNNFARALSIVVEPVPAQDWTTNVAFFQVGTAVAQVPQPPVVVNPVVVNPVVTNPVVANPNPIATYPNQSNNNGREHDNRGHDDHNNNSGNNTIPWNQYEIAPVQNSYIYNFQTSSNWLQVEFSCNMAPSNVANYYSNALVARGWRINGFESRKNKIKIGFVRGQDQMKLQLQDRGGRFTLEIARGN